MKQISIMFFAVLSTFSSFAQVGIGTTSPNTTLDVRGSLAANSRSFSTTSESVQSTDFALLFTGVSACTLTLPDATTCLGRIIHIKNTKTGTVPILTLTTTASQTIDGQSTWLLDDPNESVNVVSNGINWLIMGQSLPSGSGTSWTQGGNAVSAVKTIGTTTNYDLPFITNNVEKMRLSSSGFLGLGTNNPIARLHLVSENSEYGNDYVFDDYNSAVTQGFFIRKSRGSVAVPGNLQNGDHISFFRFVGRYNNTLNYTAGSGFDVYYRGNGTNDLTDLNFFTSGTQQMQIDENGNVAIGTTTFDANDPKVQIDMGDAGSTALTTISTIGTTNNYLQLNVQNLSNGNLASSDIVATANNGTASTVYIDMGINSAGYSTSASNPLKGSNTAYLYSTGGDFAIGNGAQNKNLVFFTNPAATAADGVERMRILGGGGVCIGTPTQNGTNKLTVNGSISASAFNVSSDRRLKSNIRNSNYGLREIMHLQPVSWSWKNSSLSSTRQLGLIAQDVKNIIPETVSGDEQNGTLSINYIELIPVLVNAVKEQQKEIDQLKQKIKALEHK